MAAGSAAGAAGAAAGSVGAAAGAGVSAAGAGVSAAGAGVSAAGAAGSAGFDSEQAAKPSEATATSAAMVIFIGVAHEIEQCFQIDSVLILRMLPDLFRFLLKIVPQRAHGFLNIIQALLLKMWVIVNSLRILFVKS